MRNFNNKLADYIEGDFLEKVVYEADKPQSLRSVARKLDISVYAVKRLIEYHKLINNKN